MRPTDEELIAVLGPVRSMVRRPYHYATSWPLEELEVVRADGTALRLILKRLTWELLTPQARATRSKEDHDPTREIETYRRVLAPSDVGPRFHGAVHDARAAWLVVDKVPGVELWQIGDVDTWVRTAEWLAQFHAMFAGRADELLALNPHLLRYDERARDRVAEDADAALARSADPRAPLLRSHLSTRRQASTGAGESTLVHGELYPSNVLVADADAELHVWPVDWETAGTGPGALDLAALSGGWDRQHRAQLVAAYAAAAGADRDSLDEEVDVWRLHLALRWIARSEGWKPPAAHARDWVGEALDAIPTGSR